MSLSKQLLILITFIFLIVFSVSFLVSVENIRSYLEGEAEIHVQDTATSLGLSLSPHMLDEQDPILRTMMNAIFDTGYYQEMRLVSVDGEDLVTLTNDLKVGNVPQWFINIFPMQTATAVSEISSGWSISGTLHVTGNAGYGYINLYDQAKQTLLYSLVVLLIAVVMLLFVLQLTLKSLKQIELQANEISTGKFSLIERMPWTSDVRTVAKAMNSMSSKIGAMIMRLNARLEQLTENLKRDPLTQLYNQETFDNNFKHSLSVGEAGYAVFVKFDDLSMVSKELGNDGVDKLLIEFAHTINHFSDVTPYRIYGSEFALLCIRFDQQQITALGETLQKALSDLGNDRGIPDLAHIGIVRFDRSSEFARLSPALLEAYEQAKNIGSNAFYVQEDSMASMSDQQWKSTIIDTIENDLANVELTNPAYNYAGNEQLKVMEEAFTVVKNRIGKVLPIGTFFSMAQEFDLVEDMDKYIVNKVLDVMVLNKYTTPVTINLSMSSVSSPAFAAWLMSKLEETKIDRSLLVFAVTAYAAAKQINVFEGFCTFVKSINAKVMLKRYSSDIIAVDALKPLQVDYIRLTRNITTDISNNQNKPDFLEFINELTQLLEIKVITETVDDDKDFEIVRDASIYGIGR
jgi:EAL domain-containing protein (putative c-di-GMP-specific phosphodiesterase class I)/GGDEF domain-containing protein